MGLFDTVIVSPKYKLPLTQKQTDTLAKCLDGKIWSREFQTKDLECWMNKFHINPTGLLSVARDDGKIKRVKHTGEVCIYDIISSETQSIDLWIEFKLQFDNGKIKTIKREMFKQNNNSERKLHAAKMAEDMQKLKTKRAKLTYKMYNTLYRKPMIWLLDRFADSLMYIYNRLQNKWRSWIIFW